MPGKALLEGLLAEVNGAHEEHGREEAPWHRILGPAMETANLRLHFLKLSHSSYIMNNESVVDIQS